MRRGETAEEIDDAAFAWVARLDRLDLTSDLQAELEHWLAVDTRRQGAFLRAQAIWQSLDRASRIDAQPEINDVAGRVSPGPERELRRPARRAWIGGGALCGGDDAHAGAAPAGR